MESENNRTVVEDQLDVENEMLNAVVLAEAIEATVITQCAAAFGMVCSCILISMLVLGLIAAVTNMPDQVFDFIGDVIVVLMVSCCYMVVVVLRQKAIAKNVARGYYHAL